MKKIAILYHSGVSSTRTVSEKIYSDIKNIFETDIYSVEELSPDFFIENYDALIIGFPVIHAAPSKRITDFIFSLSKFSREIPAFIFCTCGLYSGNSLRISAKIALKKNIVVFMSRSYNRCPASDGTLLAPFVRMFFRFGKSVWKKMESDVSNFVSKVQNSDFKKNMPNFRLYSVLNFPNKLAGHLFVFNIYTHKDKCVRCGLCVNYCPSKALVSDKENYPFFEKNMCEKCYRCIHHCPSHALSLFKNRTHKELLQ